MASVEETAILIVQAEAKGFAETAAQITNIQTQLNTLTAGYKAGTVGYEEYLKKGAELRSQLSDLTDAQKVATDAMAKHGTTAKSVAALTEQSAKGTRNLGQAALEASRGLEDLQYGVAGVLNNIPTLVMQLGGPAGVAAAISLVAVGAKVLIDHWPKLMELLGNTKPIQDAAATIKDLEAEIKKLEDKKIKLAVDYADLERAKKELKELTAAEAERERQKNQQKASEAEAGKLIQDLLTESAEGADEIQNRTVDAFAKRSIAQSVTISGIDAEIKRQKELLAIEKDPDRIRIAQMRIEELRGERTQAATMITEKAGTQYGDLLAKAKTGHGAGQARAREDLATLIGQAGFAGLASDIAGTTPEALEAADKEAKEFERHTDAAKVAGQKRRAIATDAAQKARTAAAEAKKNQAAIDRHTDAWAQEGEDFLKEKARGFEVKQRLAREANKPFLEQENRIIQAGGFAEQAEALMAQAQHAGMGANQRFGFVQQQAAQQLGQQFPRMPAQQREDMATRITAMGQQGLQNRMLTLQAQNVNANDQTLVAMQQALMAMQQMANRVNQQGAQAGRLGRGFQAVGNHMQQMAPGAGNVGGQ